MTLSLFLPITKVDAKQGIIYGVAAVEQIDKAQEIFDYATSKPNFQKWSDTISKTTDGKSLGNVRAMHGKVAAGKLEQLVFNDEAKQIEVAAKIVDQNELQKAIEGVYTGFSIGGSYEKRWKDGDSMRYTAVPAEISLVDNPCMPDATFKMIKDDGSEELRKFTSVIVEAPVPTNEQVAARAVELAKAAGTEVKWPSFIEQATIDLTKVDRPKVIEAVIKQEEVIVDASPRQPEPDLEQVWKAADGKTFAKKADAVAHNEAIAKTPTPAPTPAEALAKVTAEASELLAKKADAPVVVKKLPATIRKMSKDERAKLDKAAQGDELTKGLYTVSRLASIIEDLDYLQQSLEYEAITEQDGSLNPAELKRNITYLCATLKAICAEETAELLDAKEAEQFGDVLEMLAPMPELVKLLGTDAPDPLAKVGSKLDAATLASHDALHKYGARHSSGDKKLLQGAHDALSQLGADCASAKAAPAVELQKSLDGELAKVANLEKVITEALPVIDALRKRVESLEAQPMPGFQGTAVVVEKGGNLVADPIKTLQDLYKSNPEQLVHDVIKLSQKTPMQMT